MELHSTIGGKFPSLGGLIADGDGIPLHASDLLIEKGRSEAYLP